MNRLLALSAALVLLFLPACSGPGGDTGTIVVGVITNMRVGVDFNALHVVMHAGGATVRDELQQVSGSAGTLLTLPEELRFSDLPAGTAVDIELTAMEDVGPSSTTLVTRSAASTIVGGATLLLELELDYHCIVSPGSPGPTCTAPLTCVAGACQDDRVDPSTLPAYTSGWATQSTTDPCKLPGSTPVVIVGQGQADYLPMTDGETDQVYQGPQGGHHIWVAIRTQGLAMAGSITTVTGHFPDLGYDVGPFSVIFDLMPDEGGYCKLYGLRFQLDEVEPIATLLGHPLNVKVTVTDPDMDVGVGTRAVVLSKTYQQ
jgi:hypothetical protein